jgi:class 3 adenylate cyclase
LRNRGHASPTIRHWLAELGLAQYADAFERDDVDIAVLPDLTEADLQQLGVSLGHRKRILAALRALNGGVAAIDRPQNQSAPHAVESLTWEGERRQVTVLFCDLVGSTALSNRLDPEEYRKVLARYHETCIGCVQRFEGYVAQIQGDGIVAYFGYPLAHEGEAERAIRAALAIVQALSTVNVGLDQPLAVRVGVASGLVVVSHVLAPDKSAVGETPNLAQRLQTLAQPGEVMVSERTRALAGGAFDYLHRGLHALKGIAAPTAVWQVLGPSTAASRFEAATRDGVTPMVGREQEIALLLDRWELSRASEGQVVLLQGEPGIGKSRMLRAFQERLGERIEMTLRYQCSPYYVNSAFYPIIDHLERTLRFEREDTPEQKLDKLERRLIEELGVTSTQCCLIARAMSLATEPRYPALDMSPQRQKEETKVVLVDIVAQLATRHTTVVLFEDAHWADPSTVEVLDALVDRASQLPLLVLITYRPEFQAAWTFRSHVTPMGLTRLSRAQAASIVLRVAESKPLPSDLVTQIVDRTDGVPLFLEELTKAVLESDVLVEAAGRYEYSTGVNKLEIPATLRDSLMARLDRLIPVKEIAQIGACLGREFSYELVRAVSPMSGQQLDEALDKLTASGLVFRRGTPPRSRIHLQARARAGRRLRLAAQEQAPGVACAHRSRNTRALSWQGAVGAGAACAPLRRSRAARGGSHLLAEGRRACA